MNPGSFMILLSIEWNSVRLGGPPHGRVTGPRPVIPSHISPKFTYQVVYYFLCIPPLAFFVSMTKCPGF